MEPISVATGTLFPTRSKAYKCELSKRVVMYQRRSFAPIMLSPPPYRTSLPTEFHRLSVFSYNMVSSPVSRSTV